MHQNCLRLKFPKMMNNSMKSTWSLADLSFCLDENFVSFVHQFEGELTPWLDLNPVYGDTQERTNLLREFSGGLMAVTVFDERDFPLFDETNEIFLCGDIRCTENTMLFA